jgi:hypothetical protein
MPQSPVAEPRSSLLGSHCFTGRTAPWPHKETSLLFLPPPACPRRAPRDRSAPAVTAARPRALCAPTHMQVHPKPNPASGHAPPSQTRRGEPPARTPQVHFIPRCSAAPGPDAAAAGSQPCFAAPSLPCLCTRGPPSIPPICPDPRRAPRPAACRATRPRARPPPTPHPATCPALPVAAPPPQRGAPLTHTLLRRPPCPADAPTAYYRL